MKRSGLLVLLLSLVFFAGCASSYNIVLSNGRVITTSSKPKLNEQKNRYVFKDAQGRQMEVSPLVVREITPTSMAEKSPFQTNPSR